MLSDIFTHADAANEQRGRGLCQHIATRSLRHAGAYGRVNGPGRHGIHSDGCQLERQTTRQRLESAVHRTDNGGAGARTNGCDVCMPDGGGPAVYYAATTRRPDLANRFLFITGNVDDPEPWRFLAKIRAHVLEKPFTGRALRHALIKVIA